MPGSPLPVPISNMFLCCFLSLFYGVSLFVFGFFLFEGGLGGNSDGKTHLKIWRSKGEVQGLGIPPFDLQIFSRVFPSQFS